MGLRYMNNNLYYIEFFLYKVNGKPDDFNYNVLKWNKADGMPQNSRMIFIQKFQKCYFA